MRIKFSIGDWSHDGHSKSDNFIVDVNLTKEELDKAFMDGCTLMGLDKEQCTSTSFQFCQDYEDSAIPEQVLKGMEKFGLNPDHYFDGYHYNREESTGCYDTFHLLWLDIAKLGNPNLIYTKCEGEVTYYIGGYGLYY